GCFAQDALRRSPVLEDAEHRCISGFARKLGGIEYLIVDHQPRARAIGGLVGRELVAVHSVFLPCFLGPPAKPFAQYVDLVAGAPSTRSTRSEEHTSELQSRVDLVCRLLLEKKN